jgi:fucose 4-O-acetylase-like acetyltransferase
MSSVRVTSVPAFDVPRAPARPSPGSRLEILDIAKGVCIVLVVYGHIARGMIGPETPWLQSLDLLLYTFHMPVFFLISGFLAARPVPGGKTVGKVLSLAYLYVVWSVITVLAKALLSAVGTVNSPVGLQELARIGYAPISTLWFLYALVVVQVLAPVARRTPMLVFWLSVLVDELITLLLGAPVPILSLTAFHAPFFFAGLAIGAGALSLPSVPRLRSGPALAVGGAVFLAGAVVLEISGGRPVTFLTLPLSLLGIALVFVVSGRLLGGTSGDHLAWLGRNSLPIYLIHVLLLPVVPRLGGLMGLRDSAAFQLPLGTALGVYGSVACAAILARLGLADALGLNGRLPRPLLRLSSAAQSLLTGERLSGSR